MGSNLGCYPKLSSYGLNMLTSTMKHSKGGMEQIELPGAHLLYDASAFDSARAEDLFSTLQGEVAWEQHQLTLFGRKVGAPRLSCWVGDPGTAYTYSDTRFEPNPWTPTLLALREELQDRLKSPFNSVLANLYRDDRDYMSWHSDNEPELGEQPVIAALSFGAIRRFRLQHKYNTRLSLTLDLPPGSLFVMAGDTQRFYKHEISRTKRPAGARINLTFRHIQSVT